MFNEIKILKYFFENPNTEFNVREIARLLKITPATASKKLKELEKMKILKYRQERIYDFYKADLESSSYKDVKTYYTIRKIRESGFIDKINELYIKPTIILFGSASKGLDTETSDIDLVIISENTKEFQLKKDFEKKLNKPLQLFIVGKLDNLKNNYLINNVLNGIILQGEVIWT